jgi:formylglycine-generating enzyme required for sulfatase activity
VPKPADPEIPVRSFRPKRLLIGAIVVAGIAAGIYAVFILELGSGWLPGSTAVQGEVVEERSSDFGDALVEEFLNRNDWMEDSLNNFLLAWGALDGAQRQRATEGRLHRRLTTALHQRIREETALGGARDSSRLETLMSFAEAMGSPYRESRARSVDQKAGTEDPRAIDILDEPNVLPADGDFAAVESTGSETASPEIAEPVAASVGDTIQPADDLLPDSEVGPVAKTEAREMIDDPCPPDIANTRQPYCQDTLSDGSKGPNLVVLPTGSYEMGSDSDESEEPPHQVDIAYHVAFSRFEITAREYAQFCAATGLPCMDQPWGDYFPVVSVSWDDATLYTEWLSETTGFQYRLPSEAEWEFAVRAGTQSPYFFGDEITPSAAHSSDNGPVDSPLARTDRKINRNPFRLYHMSGNVREWTQDAWYPNYNNAPADGSARLLEEESLRTVRGGSYADPGTKLRSAAREPLERAHRDAMTGIRVVREVLQQVAER